MTDYEKQLAQTLRVEFHQFLNYFCSWLYHSTRKIEESVVILCLT